MIVKCSHSRAEAEVSSNGTDMGDTRYRLLCPILREEISKRPGHDLDMDCPYMRAVIDAVARTHRYQ
jgi:hypothetical protein